MNLSMVSFLWMGHSRRGAVAKLIADVCWAMKRIQCQQIACNALQESIKYQEVT